MTDTAGTRARSNSISEYSQLFSNNAPKPSTFINQKRHPSLSMKHDRTTSLGKAGLNVSGFTAYANEDAIDDSELSAQNNPPSIATMINRNPKSEDAVGLGRRLSQGARAIMYNGNRMRGDCLIETDNKRPSSTRTFSQSSTISSPRLGSTDHGSASPPQEAFSPVESAKTIKRRLSPTGERMLRGELAFH